MTVQRAAAYFGSAALLCAWLASAASTSRQSPTQPVAVPDKPRESETEMLARDVQEQAERLRKHLAAARDHKRPSRNPFAFQERQREAAAPVAPRLPGLLPLPAPVPRDEPPLVLIGVAEQATPQGPVRTAMIAAEGDQLFLVKAGETVIERYLVEAISVDVVQLKDLAPGGGVRRLALR
jgi:hypothetical protein